MLPSTGRVLFVGTTRPTTFSPSSRLVFKQESFTVAENGKPQKIAAFNFASNLPISVGVLLDHSGSMQPRIKAAKEAAEAEFRRHVTRLSQFCKRFLGKFVSPRLQFGDLAVNVFALASSPEHLAQVHARNDLVSNRLFELPMGLENLFRADGRTE